MRLLIRYLHVKSMVSGMETDIRLRAHSVEMLKRIILKYREMCLHLPSGRYVLLLLLL